MKKNLLSLYLIFLPLHVHAISEVTPSKVDTLYAEVHTVPFSFFERSYSYRACLLAGLGLLASPILFRNDKDFLEAALFTTFFATPFLLWASTFRDSPKKALACLDKGLLGLVVMHENDSEMVVQVYAQHFKKSTFPKSESFYELSKIKSYLDYIKTMLEEKQKSPACIKRLTALIATVDGALSVLEKDSCWIAEHDYSIGQAYQKKGA